MVRLCAQVWVALLLALLPLSLSFASSPAIHFNSSNLHLLINSSTTLHSNILAGNLTISPGLTIVTNGYEIFVADTIIAENDTFITGKALNGTRNSYCSGESGASAANSFGGSGGAGGGGNDEDYCSGGNGGTTLARPGLSSAGAGSNPSIQGHKPVLSNANIIAWYDGGFQNYLEGGSGGGGGGDGGGFYGGSGGFSSFGLYIQASSLYLKGSTIDSSGGGGNGGDCGDPWEVGSGGGGGSGAIFLAYGTAYSGGNYITTGGRSGNSGCGPQGYGGNSSAVVFQYINEPVTVSGPPPANTTGGGNPPPDNSTGGGGSPLSETCYSVNGIMANHSISVYLTGSWFNLSVNSITAGGAAVSVNGAGYALLLSQKQWVAAYGGYAYAIEIETVYADLSSLDFELCSLYGGSTTSTSTSTSITSTQLSTSTTLTTTPVISTTTTPIVEDPQPPASKNNFELAALLILLVLIALAALLAENERRKRT